MTLRRIRHACLMPYFDGVRTEYDLAKWIAKKRCANPQVTEHEYACGEAAARSERKIMTIPPRLPARSHFPPFPSAALRPYSDESESAA